MGLSLTKLLNNKNVEGHIYKSDLERWIGVPLTYQKYLELREELEHETNRN